VLLEGAGFRFIALGENEGEGEVVLDEPLEELEIDLLGRVAGVDEDEGAEEVLAVDEVVGDEFVELLAEVFGDFCVSVAGEVDEAPGFVDFEKVDFAGASRGFGNAGEAVLVGEEVDEGGFSDI